MAKGRKSAKTKALGKTQRVIDWTLFEKLCKMMLNKQQICEIFNYSYNHFGERVKQHYNQNFSVVHKRFSVEGYSKFRQKALQMALEGNERMLIYIMERCEVWMNDPAVIEAQQKIAPTTATDLRKLLKKTVDKDPFMDNIEDAQVVEYKEIKDDNKS